MPLPSDFHFNQKNLQDFKDCPRRFQLRYLLKREWPAPVSEPVVEMEELMNLGYRFHELVHRFFLGIIPEEGSFEDSDAILGGWWRNFHKFIASSASGKILPECLLKGHLQNFQLIAKYDLLQVINPYEIIIFDWKTGNKPLSRDYLQTRMQTRLYLFLLSLAGEVILPEINDHPENIRMVYWNPNFPENSLEFPYSRDEYEVDSSNILGIMDEISHTTDEIYQMTSDSRKCMYCNYRSLCERGEKAGDFNEMTDFTEIWDLDNFDIDQIKEIEY